MQKCRRRKDNIKQKPSSTGTLDPKVRTIRNHALRGSAHLRGSKLSSYTWLMIRTWVSKTLKALLWLMSRFTTFRWCSRKLDQTMTPMRACVAQEGVQATTQVSSKTSSNCCRSRLPFVTSSRARKTRVRWGRTTCILLLSRAPARISNSRMIVSQTA